MEKCKICGENLDMRNAKFILSELTMTISYQEIKFCSKKCFLEFIIKNFRREINKIL